ncbi:MAG TPA: hypothetical protein VKC34_04220 [Blastocatellia bacterium]|nr:hypothetical protein [Blastocatellia bacterium]
MTKEQREELEKWLDKTDFFTATEKLAPAVGPSEARSLRHMAGQVVIDRLSEMRRELKRLEAVCQRMEHAVRPALSGQPVNGTTYVNHFQPLDGWVASLLETYIGLLVTARPLERAGKVDQLCIALRQIVPFQERGDRQKLFTDFLKL